MADTVNEMLCCPSCRGELILCPGILSERPVEKELHCNGCRRTYIHNGAYYDFMENRNLVYRSRREKFFRKISAGIYTPLTNTMFLLCGGAGSARNEVMERIRVRDGDSVLETGIGYGENFLWLTRRVNGLILHGLDIQKEMMSHCVSNLRRWKIGAELTRADAQSLPYRDNAFDVVFHLGAINLFEDKRKAINEMVRVSKAGTHIVIADESQKAGRLFNIFTGLSDKVVPPVDMVPPGMKNITLTTIWRGYGYVIEFDVVKEEISPVH